MIIVSRRRNKINKKFPYRTGSAAERGTLPCSNTQVKKLPGGAVSAKQKERIFTNVSAVNTYFCQRAVKRSYRYGATDASGYY